MALFVATAGVGGPALGQAPPPVDAGPGAQAEPEAPPPPVGEDAGTEPPPAMPQPTAVPEPKQGPEPRVVPPEERPSAPAPSAPGGSAATEPVGPASASPEATAQEDAAAQAEAALEAEAAVDADAAAEEEDAREIITDTSGGTTTFPEQARGWEEAPGVEDEDVVLAVPRAILFVPRLVLEVVFWPLEQAVVLGDQWHVIGYTERLLYFDEEHKFGWEPTASYRSRLGLTVGATVFHNSLFGHDERAALSAKFLGGYAHSYEASLEGNRMGGTRLWLETRVRYETENVSLFGGIGMTDADEQGPGLAPRAANHRTYFGQERGLGLLRVGYTAGEPGGFFKPGIALIGNARTFSRAARRVQTTDVYDTSQIVGFDDEVKTLEVQANLVADFRADGGLDSRGTYFEVFGGRAVGSGYKYYHYGAEFFHTINLYKKTRLLVLRTALEGVAAEPDRMPFSDLPRLGGADRLRGFMEGEFRDNLAAFASIEYHYPIHRNIMGELFIDAGRVSDRFEDLYRFKDWKLGYGGGLLIGSDDGITFRFDLSYGDDFQVYLSTDVARAFEGRSAQL